MHRLRCKFRWHIKRIARDGTIWFFQQLSNAHTSDWIGPNNLEITRKIKKKRRNHYRLYILLSILTRISAANRSIKKVTGAGERWRYALQCCLGPFSMIPSLVGRSILNFEDRLFFTRSSTRSFISVPTELEMNGSCTESRQPTFSFWN